jgi:hypothetical protein
MRLTIIADDCMVYVDSAAIRVPQLADLIDGDIHAVQWDGQRGEIEWKPDEDGAKRPNTKIDRIEQFKPVIDAWTVESARTQQP